MNSSDMLNWFERSTFRCESIDTIDAFMGGPKYFVSSLWNLSKPKNNCIFPDEDEHLF